MEQLFIPSSEANEREKEGAERERKGEARRGGGGDRKRERLGSQRGERDDKDPRWVAPLAPLRPTNSLRHCHGMENGIPL